MCGRSAILTQSNKHRNTVTRFLSELAKSKAEGKRKSGAKSKTKFPKVLSEAYLGHYK